MRRLLGCLLFAAMLTGLAGEANAQGRWGTYWIQIKNSAGFTIRYRYQLIYPWIEWTSPWEATLLGSSRHEISINRYHLSVPGEELLQSINVEVEYSNGTSWNFLCKEFFGPPTNGVLTAKGNLFAPQGCTKHTQ